MKMFMMALSRWNKVFYLVVLVVVSQASANEAKQVFDSLYASRIHGVARTPERADDVALAKELLDTAKSSDETPSLLALACEEAFDLGSTHSDGLAITQA